MIPQATPIEMSGHFFNGSALMNTSLMTTTGSGSITGSSMTGMSSALHLSQLMFSGGLSSLQSGHDCETLRVFPATPGNRLRAISVSSSGRFTSPGVKKSG
jgi:hypothetical protein